MTTLISVLLGMAISRALYSAGVGADRWQFWVVCAGCIGMALTFYFM